MAITVDKANIGTATQDAAPTDSISLTTTQTVASNGFIVFGIGWSGTNSLPTTMAGGGLTWTIDKSGAGGSRGFMLASAQAPSGLTSGATLTATWAAGEILGSYLALGAMSLLGVKTSSPVDGTPLGATVDSAANWTTGNYAIVAGSIVVGGCQEVNNAVSNAATGGSSEAWESVDASDAYGATMCYRIEASAGSYAVTGTWSGGTANVNVAVAYLAGATTPDTGLAWIRA